MIVAEKTLVCDKLRGNVVDKKLRESGMARKHRSNRRRSHMMMRWLYINHRTLYSRWYVAVAGIIAVLMLAFATTPKARAHDPDTHQVDDLSKATSEAYGVCCSGDDYVRVSTWETTATGYRVLYKGVWYEGSRRTKVNNMENPDGEAKVWINGPPGAQYIRCFMAGARS